MLAGLRVARGKLTVTGTPNRLSNCVISVVKTQFTNMVVGRIPQPEARGLETHALKRRFPICVPRIFQNVFSFNFCVLNLYVRNVIRST